MNNTYAISLLVLLSGCSKQAPNTSAERIVPILAVSMYESPLIDKEIALNDPYAIDLAIEKTTDQQFTLVINMELFGGSFFVSPHSSTDFKGKFRVEVANDRNLIIGSEFIETPRSAEVIDPHPFVDGLVNWVAQDTRYDYPLKVRSQSDFDIGGKLVFTIEPKCTLEEIPVMFKYRSGILTVEKWKC
jgi:hypothetical protein